MKKRIVSAVLCTAMVAGSLAGCGSKKAEAVSYTHLIIAYGKQTVNGGLDSFQNFSEL